MEFVKVDCPSSLQDEAEQQLSQCDNKIREIFCKLKDSELIHHCLIKLINLDKFFLLWTLYSNIKKFLK